MIPSNRPPDDHHFSSLINFEGVTYKLVNFLHCEEIEIRLLSSAASD